MGDCQGGGLDVGTFMVMLRLVQVFTIIIADGSFHTDGVLINMPLGPSNGFDNRWLFVGNLFVKGKINCRKYKCLSLIFFRRVNPVGLLAG